MKKLEKMFKDAGLYSLDSPWVIEATDEKVFSVVKAYMENVKALSPLEQSENKEEWVSVTEDILFDLGFDKITSFNVLNSFIKNIGRNRHISVGCVGTPNLMVFLCETDREDYRKVNDLICLHNWDYDGEIYLHQLQNIISTLTRQERE